MGFILDVALARKCGILALEDWLYRGIFQQAWPDGVGTWQRKLFLYILFSLLHEAKHLYNQGSLIVNRIRLYFYVPAAEVAGHVTVTDFGLLQLRFDLFVCSLRTYRARFDIVPRINLLQPPVPTLSNTSVALQPI
jgi:hypothetical protein